MVASLRWISNATLAITSELVKLSTLNLELRLLRAMWDKLIAWKLAMESPMREIKALPQASGRLRFMDADEIATLLAVCDVDQAPVVTVALHTGLRLSEVKHLEWADVHLARGMLRVVARKGGKSRVICR